MNIYQRKKRWKWILFGAGIIIVSASLYYTNTLVKKIASEERKNIKIWADAIQHKADLVNYTDNFFSQLEVEERKRVELLAEAYKNITRETTSEALNFYLKLISLNTTIPVILTDETDRISNAVNVDFDIDSARFLTGKLKEEFTVYEPIMINYYANKKIMLYYKDSRLFYELRLVLDDLTESFFSEVVINSASVPVIVTDSSKTRVYQFGLIDPVKIKNPDFVKRTLNEMASQNRPIVIDLANRGKRYIFYKDSALLSNLRYYPIVQFIVMGIFLFISYLVFSTSRKSEQNQVWVGLAKETAHQLGTPLSSMIAWVEILRLKEIDPAVTNEMQKDIDRLGQITERFSKIGSEPKLEVLNIVPVIGDMISYIKTRSSPKMNFRINVHGDQNKPVPLNIHLFGWVIENLAKNAIDATGGNGNITIDIDDDESHIFIDFSDDGKGIHKSQFKSIFHPGFTSKKRGWGLGLSLARRIIRDYHKGKIYVKNSALNKGTTFRIVLNKFMH